MLFVCIYFGSLYDIFYFYGSPESYKAGTFFNYEKYSETSKPQLSPTKISIARVHYNLSNCESGIK